MDTIGKKCLHAFFGAVVGFGAGYLSVFSRYGKPEHLTWYCISGAVLFAVLAFCVTDDFWENLRDYIRW